MFKWNLDGLHDNLVWLTKMCSKSSMTSNIQTNHESVSTAGTNCQHVSSRAQWQNRRVLGVQLSWFYVINIVHPNDIFSQNFVYLHPARSVKSNGIFYCYHNTLPLSCFSFPSSPSPPCHNRITFNNAKMLSVFIVGSIDLDYEFVSPMKISKGAIRSLEFFRLKDKSHKSALLLPNFVPCDNCIKQQENQWNFCKKDCTTLLVCFNINVYYWYQTWRTCAWRWKSGNWCVTESRKR